MMLPSVGGRSPLFTLSVSAACVLVFMFAFLAWQSPPRMVFHGGPNTGMYVTIVWTHMGRKRHQSPPSLLCPS